MKPLDAWVLRLVDRVRLAVAAVRRERCGAFWMTVLLVYVWGVAILTALLVGQALR
ncbi:MAG: hypothetical protein ACRDUY_08120 [Nitriliruptorales bacterium]